jgi:hypothetical protein
VSNVLIVVCPQIEDLKNGLHAICRQKRELIHFELGELDEFLGLKEGFEMLHLPGAHYHQDHSLSQSPPASKEKKFKLFFYIPIL